MVLERIGSDAALPLALVGIIDARVRFVEAATHGAAEARARLEARVARLEPDE